MAKEQKITVHVPYGNREFEIELNVVELSLDDGRIIQHFEVPDALRGRGPVFELGRTYMKERRIPKALEAGKISADQAKMIEGLIDSHDSMPKRDRRLARNVMHTMDRDESGSKTSAEADRRASERFRRLSTGYQKRRQSELKDAKVQDVCGKAFTGLEVDCVGRIREFDYPWLVPMKDLDRKVEAENRLRTPDLSEADRAAAQKVIDEYWEKLDDNYDAYYALRDKLLMSSSSPDDLGRKIDNLRKAKTAWEGKPFARMMATEHTDFYVSQPYHYGMQLIALQLQCEGRFVDGPSLAFYRFMHEPHEYLSRIVPAAHPVYYLFLQSGFFREALVEFGAERISPDSAPSVETALKFCSATLAVVETYSEEVHKERGRDMKRQGKRHGEFSFDESRGTVETGSGGAKRGAEHHEVERYYRQEQMKPGPAVSEEQVREKFPNGTDARDVIVYLRANGILGFAKTKVNDLAREFDCDRRTIQRWKNRGQQLIHNKGQEHGVNLADLL